MKKISKLVSCALAFAMVLSLAACGGNSDQKSTTAAPAETEAVTTAAQAENDTKAPAETEAGTTAAAADTDGKTFKIGIIQLTEHPALDASYEGFVEGLKASGLEEGVNIEIDYQNAQNEIANCDTIAEKLINDGCDLILAIATPAAQAVAGKTTTIPILVTAVTDPADAGLVESNEAPGGNISGTSDLTPVKEQIQLLQQILPDAKKIAIMYCSSEDNSIFQANMAKAECEAAKLEYDEVTVSDSNQIQQVVESIIGKYDAIYIPTDNLLAEGMATVTQVANVNGLPCIVGEEGMVENGGLATYGIDYFEIGRMAGEQAADILLNGTDIATIPIGYLAAEDCSLSVNTTAAKDLGIELPEDLLKDANVYE